MFSVGHVVCVRRRTTASKAEVVKGVFIRCGTAKEVGPRVERGELENVSIFSIMFFRGVGVCLFMFLVALSFSACTPSLHDAIARGGTDLVSQLLDQNPNLVKALDKKRKTPLHCAVTYKNLHAMDLLYAKGADVNAQDITGMTPLHVAAMLGRAEEAKWLLAHGANPAIVDYFGDMPIHTAAIFGHGHIIKLLNDAGIPLDTPNAKGETPLQIARRYRQERLVNFLSRRLETSS